MLVYWMCPLLHSSWTLSLLYVSAAVVYAVPFQTSIVPFFCCEWSAPHFFIKNIAIFNSPFPDPLNSPQIADDFRFPLCEYAWIIKLLFWYSNSAWCIDYDIAILLVIYFFTLHYLMNNRIAPAALKLLPGFTNINISWQDTQG